MASDRPLRRVMLVGAACAVLTILLAGGAPARAADAWWRPVALLGTRVTRVSAIGDRIMVRTGTGATLLSSDGGKSFAAPAGNTLFPPLNVVKVEGNTWEVDPSGRVLRAAGSGGPVPDPGSP